MAARRAPAAASCVTHPTAPLGSDFRKRELVSSRCVSVENSSVRTSEEDYRHSDRIAHARWLGLNNPFANSDESISCAICNMRENATPATRRAAAAAGDSPWMECIARCTAPRACARRAKRARDMLRHKSLLVEARSSAAGAGARNALAAAARTPLSWYRGQLHFFRRDLMAHCVPGPNMPQRISRCYGSIIYWLPFKHASFCELFVHKGRVECGHRSQSRGFCAVRRWSLNERQFCSAEHLNARAIPDELRHYNYDDSTRDNGFDLMSATNAVLSNCTSDRGLSASGGTSQICTQQQWECSMEGRREGASCGARRRPGADGTRYGIGARSICF
ncbi:unnamed protein product [Colias eurytheme]|nr:unnamed protein product [Colias eurytheme]